MEEDRGWTGGQRDPYSSLVHEWEINAGDRESGKGALLSQRMIGRGKGLTLIIIRDDLLPTHFSLSFFPLFLALPPSLSVPCRWSTVILGWQIWMNRTLVAANAGTKPDMPRGFQRCGLSPIAWGAHQPSFAGTPAAARRPKCPLSVFFAVGGSMALSAPSSIHLSSSHPQLVDCGLGTGDWGLGTVDPQAASQTTTAQDSAQSRRQDDCAKL